MAEDIYDALNPLERYEENSFSFWYPKIQNCGIPVPKSLIFKTPESLYREFCSDNLEAALAKTTKWYDEAIAPALNEAGLYCRPLFIKNGMFSNKFDASTCIVQAQQIPYAFIMINRGAILAEAGGLDELVVRERIQSNVLDTPCIYKGLPLRPEFRVFYDFTLRRPIFTANYWDWDYVFPHLFDATDRIVFEHERPRIATAYEENRSYVEDLVATHMKNVEGLEGPWSIDIMMDKRCGKKSFYLIDMAVAEMSAYWELRPGNEEAYAKKRKKEERRYKERQAYIASLLVKEE